MSDETEVELSQAEYNAQRLEQERGAPAPEVETHDDHEEEPKAEAKPEEKERPWQKKAPPETIPYGRFSEVANERRALAQRAAELEAKLAEYESRNKSTLVEDVDDLDYSQFVKPNGEPDTDAAMKARDEILIRKAGEKIREQLRQEMQAEAEQRQRDAIVGEYQRRASEYSKDDPEFSAKEEYVVSVLQHPQNARFLDRSVLEALAEDENAPHIIAALAEDENLLATLLMGPKKALRTIAELSIAAKGAPAPAKAPVIPPKPAFTPAATKPVVRIPQTVDSPRTGKKSIEDMSPKEYAAYRAKGGSAW